MGFFSRFGRVDPEELTAATVYSAVVGQARTPAFYSDLGVEDTVNGRFDMIVLHAMLVMRRLRSEGARGAAMAQALFDYMFKDMDRSLREIGVGDMSVGKHIKKMAKAFYGRAEEYELGMEQGAMALGVALKRNVLRRSDAGDKQIALLAAYVLEADKAVNTTGIDDLARGEIRWAAVRAV